MPLSNDPAKRARQLANLTPRPPATPAGNRRAVSHGTYSAALVADVEAEVREIMDALAGVAPVRASDGGLPAADLVAVERAARLLRRYRHIEAWLDLHGQLEERTGRVKPAAHLAIELGEALDRALARLGLDPSSRANLGLDLARSADLATAMSEPDAERRRGLLREAGLGEEDGE